MRKALGRNLVSGREILLSLFFWVGLLEKMEIYTPLKYSEKGGKSLTSLMISGKTFSRPPLLRYFLSKCFFFSVVVEPHVIIRQTETTRRECGGCRSAACQNDRHQKEEFEKAEERERVDG